jgi:hypothetical protein
MYVLDSKVNKSLISIRDCLLSEYLTWLSSYYNKITENKRRLSRNAVSCFVTNSYNGYLAGYGRVGLTLDENSYSKSVIVNGRDTKRKISYTYTRSFLNFLVEVGYIELDIAEKPTFTFSYGKWEMDDRGSSYSIFKPKLLGLFYAVGDFEVEQRVNVLFLRNKAKNNIPFKATEQTEYTKEFLDGFNSFSMGYIVSCKDVVYDVQMYKVFNVDFYKGGRSFMQNSIQSLSSEDRKHIQIDNKPVCIFDYVGFEPSLCYTMSQEVFEGDDYYELDTLKDYDKITLRKLVKSAMLVMFNVKRRDQALEAINNVFAEEYDVKVLYNEGKIPSEHIPVRVLVEQIEKKHPLILDKFYKGFGLQLQYAGSYISDYIIDHMMQNYKCLVLSVFDEFIAQEEYRDTLYNTMVKAYENVLGFSDNCKIKCEK